MLLFSISKKVFKKELKMFLSSCSWMFSQVSFVKVSKNVAIESLVITHVLHVNLAPFPVVKTLFKIRCFAS
jgi:hypothetical protein